MAFVVELCLQLVFWLDWFVGLSFWAFLLWIEPGYWVVEFFSQFERISETGFEVVVGWEDWLMRFFDVLFCFRFADSELWCSSGVYSQLFVEPPDWARSWVEVETLELVWVLILWRFVVMIGDLGCWVFGSSWHTFYLLLSSAFWTSSFGSWN